MSYADKRSMKAPNRFKLFLIARFYICCKRRNLVGAVSIGTWTDSSMLSPSLSKAYFVAYLGLPGFRMAVI